MGVKGLYAAGETSGGHCGADRLGGNAIASTQVFGAIAGSDAANWSKNVQWTPISISDIKEKLICDLDTKKGGIVDISAYKNEIREIMWECGAIIRSEKQSDEGLRRLASLEESFNPIEQCIKRIKIKDAGELKNWFKLSKLMLEVMKIRKESRGPHYRIDYPDTDKKYEGMIEVKKEHNLYSYTIVRKDNE